MVYTTLKFGPADLYNDESVYVELIGAAAGHKLPMSAMPSAPLPEGRLDTALAAGIPVTSWMFALARKVVGTLYERANAWLVSAHCLGGTDGHLSLSIAKAAVADNLEPVGYEIRGPNRPMHPQEGALVGQIYAMAHGLDSITLSAVLGHGQIQITLTHLEPK